MTKFSGWYHTHMSHNGQSNTYDWKGYKTPFRRSGHILSVLADSIVMNSQQLSQIFMHAHKTKSLNITLKDRDRGMGC